MTGYDIIGMVPRHVFKLCELGRDSARQIALDAGLVPILAAISFSCDCGKCLALEKKVRLPAVDN